MDQIPPMVLIPRARNSHDAHYAMKILIAGKPLDESMMDEVKKCAASLAADDSIRPRLGSLDTELLGGIPDAIRGDRKFMELLRHKSQIDTLDFVIPRKPGFTGWMMQRLRRILWKLLRYQHDRMVTRQNRVNAWIISALESKTESLQIEVDELRDRLSRLEFPESPKNNPITDSDKR